MVFGYLSDEREINVAKAAVLGKGRRKAVFVWQKTAIAEKETAI